MVEHLTAAVERLTEAVEHAREETRTVRKEMHLEAVRRRRIGWVAAGTAVALVIALAVGIVGWVDQRGEQARIRDVVATDCPALRDFATFDIPGNSGELARLVVRDYYAAYLARCVDITGPLPPIDPDATRPAPQRIPAPTPTRSP